mmetsp:Transcript_41485/g.125676  ORF Transcript_41485/g.125676 Transcript_41485/m.125676 type:complete len:931 (-) Transcript_41485:133-2925(-)
MGGGGADDGGRNAVIGGKKKRNDGGTRSSITVLLLGDDGVGKSSLVSTYVSRHFSEAVPGVMTRVRLPPDPTSGNCVTTIVDSRGADAALAAAAARASGGTAGMNRTLSVASLTESGRLAADGGERNDRPDERMQQGSQQLETSTISLASTIGGASSIVAGGIENIDSIVLVYDLDRVETFYRLENHWLPLIERCYNGELPVILAGNKMDLFGQSGAAAAATSDERSLARSRQQIVSILQRFKFVRQCIKCSARNLLNVDEVFLKARQAVLYPITPLYDLDEGRIAPGCRRAFTRVFRMHDLDHDGLLSDSELNTFQSRAFRVPLAERDLAGWKKVVSKNNPAEEAVVRNGKFTVSGFLAIFDVFIGQNRLEVPWRILRMFGYDDDLNLEIPESVTASSSGDGSGLSLKASWRLTPSARRFLTAVFHQFDSNSDGVLSTDDVLSIFSIVPEPSLPPWHPLRSPSVLKGCLSTPTADVNPPTSPRSGSPSSPSSGSGHVESPSSPPLSASGITILSAASLPSVDAYADGGNGTESSPENDNIHTLLPRPLSFLDWMGHWHMISSISPAAARTELFRLGHVEDQGRKASTMAPPSPRKRPGKKAAVSPAADFSSVLIPSKELRVLVLGSQGCGKTSLLNSLCTQGDEWGHLIQASPLDTVKTKKPETSCTYVRLKRPDVSKHPKRGKIQEGKDEEFVAHIIMTEVPEAGKSTAGEQLSAEVASMISKDEEKNRCFDLVLLAFDCNIASSLEYVKEIERTMLSDDVPRVFIGTKADQGSDDVEAKSMTGEGIAVPNAARQHCAELDLEPPVITSALEMNVAGCEVGEEVDRQQRVSGFLSHLACSVLSREEASNGGLRSTPHAEKNRRAAARRRRMMWLGGVVTVSVAVAIGVGAIWGSKKEGQKNRLTWLRSLLRLDVSKAVATESASTSSA